MLPPAVKNIVVWVAVIFSRKPPSMWIHSVAQFFGSWPTVQVELEPPGIVLGS